MNKITRLVLFSMLIVSLALTGCTRSASKTVVETPAATGEIPFPLPTENALQNPSASAQPTAAAPAGPTSAAPAEATLPPLVLPTSTPAATAVPTAAPTFAVVPTATPGLPSTYALQPGEWPYCIARRFNINPGALLDANALDMNSRPAAGTVLKIPAGAAAWGSGSRALIDHPAVYTVKPGDTIYSIACEFGDVDPNAIILANNLTAPYSLTGGQTIQVP